MKLNKKAALELSVNAIVILIIAIVMLGLGLGFVRTLFGGATNKFSALIDQEQDPAPPSSSNIISLSRESILTSPKSNNVIKIAVYNPTADDFGSGGSCTGPDIAKASDCKNYDGFPAALCTALGCANCGAASPDKTTTDPFKCSTMAKVDCEAVALVDDQVCKWDLTIGGTGVSPQIKCQKILTHEDNFTVNSKIIKAGGYETFDALFTMPQSAVQGTTDLCQIIITGGGNNYYKDFTIKIK